MNCLPAIFIAWKDGFTSDELYDALSNLTISDMRFQPVAGRNGSILINDAYNASPTSMIAAINTLAKILPEKEKTVVLGDMFELGDDSTLMHESVGHHLKDYNINVITVGDTSQSISSIAGGVHFSDVASAAHYLKNHLHPQSLMLFKASRAMKLENLISLLQS